MVEPDLALEVLVVPFDAAQPFGHVFIAHARPLWFVITCERVLLHSELAHWVLAGERCAAQPARRVPDRTDVREQAVGLRSVRAASLFVSSTSGRSNSRSSSRVTS